MSEVNAVMERFAKEHLLCGRIDWVGTMEDAAEIARSVPDALRAQLPMNAPWMGQRFAALNGSIRCEFTGRREDREGGIGQRVWRVFVADSSMQANILLRRLASLGGEFEAVRGEVRKIYARVTGGVA